MAHDPTTAPLLQLSAVRKSYNVGQPSEAEVLHGIDLQLRASEFIALVGPSGSGKSTLLNILGLLERMSSGSYQLLGQETHRLSDDRLTLLRRQSLGFVFQFHHLLPAFTALENVTLPALMAHGVVSGADKDRALQLLRAVGLGQALHKKPSELSGGMQQRVAIARALVQQPALVLADEPTGNLDTQSSDDVFALLREIHAQQGTAFLIVTHDPRLAARCDRLVEMVDGQIAQDAHTPHM
ncbi:ABC transporter ATP-binding protein [Comamonas aquatica]|uniref:ABC transporter ATP-binding protein n=1 Tax=Comamonas aquatica TaxID=225991 RepID=A0AA43AXH2_9BURK|nr:ABC transporter ATP-binding protein [Comamonas aquatica]MDH1427166.1 ABC transporter ATP-binding protein [Comamonas aquatica]MDH1605632.1 ABC transporter ATP-binding protein [Comamonas aquatica]MDH1617665.1 ABC transporter ATP-binding protein [Comamonas aquatica]MDH2005634.1 ABC transporter ATP-binding protein [Comamonas aquatica]